MLRGIQRWHVQDRTHRLYWTQLSKSHKIETRSLLKSVSLKQSLSSISDQKKKKFQNRLSYIFLYLIIIIQGKEGIFHSDSKQYVASLLRVCKMELATFHLNATCTPGLSVFKIHSFFLQSHSRFCWTHLHHLFLPPVRLENTFCSFFLCRVSHIFRFFSAIIRVSKVYCLSSRFLAGLPGPSLSGCPFLSCLLTLNLSV